MSDYRRYFVAGGCFFLTLVTYNRRPILVSDPARRFLRESIAMVRRRWAFQIVATVLLPDHIHLLMQLPPADSNYSTRIKRIKEEFTLRWRAQSLPEPKVTEAQRAKGERGIWQSRFFEHTVKDEDDLKRCVDYVHWNPVKHQLVNRVRDWKWSSFHRFVAAGEYSVDWGRTMPPSIEADGEWGE
ncbi:MAG: transposase [Fuerstiella sp.]